MASQALDHARSEPPGAPFPVEMRIPEGFEADDLATWPRVAGRIEFVQGRLWYMPPCDDVQQEVAAAVTHALVAWAEAHAGFVIGSNEAGMKLGGDVRAADAGVWRRAEVGPPRGRLREAPPVLAVEVAGGDDDEVALRAKTRWYLEHGISVVWLVLPERRQVIVVTGAGETRHVPGDRLAEHPVLPGLSPAVGSLFVQIDRR
jgi:Uma2 family endonuclease